MLIRSRAARSEGLAPCGPGYWKTFMCAATRSSKPRSCSRSSMCRCTASQGRRRRAPISGGPNGCSAAAELIKGLDESRALIYRQVTLPSSHEEELRWRRARAKRSRSGSWRSGSWSRVTSRRDPSRSSSSTSPPARRSRPHTATTATRRPSTGSRAS